MQQPWDDRLLWWSHGGSRGGCLKGHSDAIWEISAWIYASPIAPYPGPMVNRNELSCQEAAFPPLPPAPEAWHVLCISLALCSTSPASAKPINTVIRGTQFMSRWGQRCSHATGKTKNFSLTSHFSLRVKLGFHYVMIKYCGCLCLDLLSLFQT